MTRLFALVALCLSLAACTAKLTEPPKDLGQFQLGHNVVVAPNLTKGPLSREATKEEWIAAMQDAVGARFGPERYDGDRYYHLGISVEGYVLARAGIPIIASPKSALIVNVTVWDDAAGKKLNEEPHQIAVSETISGETFISSGLTQSRETQMKNLSFNMAAAIERWLDENKGWFEG